MSGETLELDRMRCWRCSATLAKLRLVDGSVVEIKCHRCNAMVRALAPTETSTMQTKALDTLYSRHL
jgi:phage FluMu protein Com